MLSLGADPNATDEAKLHPLDWAAFTGQLPLVELLVAKGAKDLKTPLFLAIQQQHILAAKFLLDHGADPNACCRYGSSQTALHIAAGKGDIEAALLLLEHGAQVNVSEQNQETPLDYAVGQTSKEMVELLFAHGAIITGKPPGHWSVFHEWALGAGDPHIADVLLFHKADINAPCDGHDGQTPLHFAASQGQLQAVEWLLKNGANINARDKNGATPLRLLRSHGRILRKDVADLLRSRGGKE